MEYGVLIGDESYMVDSSDLVPTGELLSREAIYVDRSIGLDHDPIPEKANFTRFLSLFKGVWDSHPPPGIRSRRHF